MTEPAQPHQEFRRVHRLSPLLRMWAVLVALVTVVLLNAVEPIMNWVRKGELFDGTVALWALAGAVAAFVVLVLVLFSVSQLWWAKTGFRLTEEEIQFKRGVLTNQVRTARYDRTQAVDIVEPLAPRLFGLAGVRVEVAGGTGSAIEIEFLPRAEAEALRAEILARIAAKGSGPAQLADASAEAAGEGVAKQSYLVPPIPIGRSLAATALQLSTIITVIAMLTPLLTGLSFAAAVPVLVGLLPMVWRTVDQSWRFNATHVDEVFNLTYGLANRRRQAMPHTRIHAVQLKQPLLWRPFGWWTVSITTAGYGSERSQATGTSKLLPVGTFEQAMAVIDAVGPLTGKELAAGHADFRTPPRAKWVSPVDWRQQSAAVRGNAATVTFGRLTRRFQMVEVPHIQELSFEQGPVQRALHLANVRFDLVPGAVKITARDLDEGDARALLEALRTRELPPLERLDPTDPTEPVT